MKKLLIFLVVLIAAGAGAVYYLSSNAGGLVRDAVVEYVPPMIGADVKLANVDLDAPNGTAKISGLVIGNPQGFKSDHLFKIDNMSMKLDVDSVISSVTGGGEGVITINEVRLDAPDMIYEIGSEGNNVSKIQENVEKYIQDLGIETSDEESQLKYIVENVYINETKVKFASDMLGGKGLGVTLPNLHVSDIGKKENGAIASDVLKQIFDVISGSAQQAATTGAIGDALGGIKDVGENVVKELEDKVVDEVGSALKGLIPQD